MTEKENPMREVKHITYNILRDSVSIMGEDVGLGSGGRGYITRLHGDGWSIVETEPGDKPGEIVCKLEREAPLSITERLTTLHERIDAVIGDVGIGGEIKRDLLAIIQDTEVLEDNQAALEDLTHDLVIANDIVRSGGLFGK